MSTSDTEIMVDFPGGGLPAGDYLLTVSKGTGQSQNDEYDLTIGAVGTPGEDGGPGPPGPPGEPGPSGGLAEQSCPAGEFVTGVMADGSLQCTPANIVVSSAIDPIRGQATFIQCPTNTTVLTGGLLCFNTNTDSAFAPIVFNEFDLEIGNVPPNGIGCNFKENGGLPLVAANVEFCKCHAICSPSS